MKFIMRRFVKFSSDVMTDLIATSTPLNMIITNKSILYTYYVVLLGLGQLDRLPACC